MKVLLLYTLVVCLSSADVHKNLTVGQNELCTTPYASTVSFSNGIVFDTRDGEPTLPNNLRYYNQTEGYYIIQLDGPIRREWVDELIFCGLHIENYIPNYSLIAYATQDKVDRIATKPFIRWTGIFHPAYKLHRDLLSAHGRIRITIQIFPNESTKEIAGRIEKKGYRIVNILDHALCKTIDAIVNLERVGEIARIPGVLWIQQWKPATPCNDDCQWVVQTGWQSSVPPDSVGRRAWHEGITGAGLVLSTSDSGIRTDHEMFLDVNHPINNPGTYPGHRKIVAYKVYEGATFGEYMPFPHGTFGACNVAGNDTLMGTSDFDGMAKDAKIYFLDVVNDYGAWVMFANLAPLYDSIYPAHGLGSDILQHSGSWGWESTTGCYLIQDASTDAYIWSHRDFLNIFAAGNEADSMTIREPAIAKNVITIGGTSNGTLSNMIYLLSSRGPTQDGRIKPTIMAPGHAITSANGTGTSGYFPWAGTSWATTAANGAIGLIRQYLLAGFYPTGMENPADSIHYQSAALLRAMAIVSADPNVGSWYVPDYNIGWGRIDVDSVLYFNGDTRRVLLLDDTIGINTGQSVTDSFEVTSGVPLRICMTWTDTAAAPNANPTLVNDLNLELIAPSGTHYRGNQYNNGQSIPNPSAWDTRNVEECCRIDNPEAGIWYVNVTGQNVPFGPQPFAHAITGDVTPAVGFEEIKIAKPAMLKLWVSPNPFQHTTKFRYEIYDMGYEIHEVSLQIYDATGRLVKFYDLVSRISSSTSPIQWDGTDLALRQLGSGVYFAKLSVDDYSQTKKVLLIR